VELPFLTLDFFGSSTLLYPILGYPDELTQVWSNLINNALQAMNFQGCLEISVFQKDSAIVVSIADSGGGIAPEIQIMDKHTSIVKASGQPGHTKFSVWSPI
jgi:signal transduction histidine kinase